MLRLLARAEQRIISSIGLRIGLIVIRADDELGLEKAGSVSSFIYSPWHLSMPHDIQTYIESLVTEKLKDAVILEAVYRFTIDRTRIFLVKITGGSDGPNIQFKRGHAPPHYPYPLDPFSRRVLAILAKEAPSCFTH